MANIIELCKDFAIEESQEGRFLIDKRNKRLVDIGHNELTYIELKRYTGFFNFKVKSSLGTGLIQLKNNGFLFGYSDITGTKSCDEHVLKLEDVLVIPSEYEDVSVQHIFERFGVQFPIGRKHAFCYDVFANGHKLENASGFNVTVNMRRTKAECISQIISYRNKEIFVTTEQDEIIFFAPYDNFPEFCAIEDADHYSSIRPSYSEYKTDIWMYNADGKVGIVYLDSDKVIQSYIIDEVPFIHKDRVYFINENYIIYDFHQKYVYYRGSFCGTMNYFCTKKRTSFFVVVDKGFFVGKTFFKFCDEQYYCLHQKDISDVVQGKKITLESGANIYKFILDFSTGEAVSC